MTRRNIAAVLFAIALAAFLLAALSAFGLLGTASLNEFGWLLAGLACVAGGLLVERLG